MHEPIPTAADVRAALARRKLKIYVVGARVGLHPANLSMILNEHRALSPELAERLMRAIEQEPR